MNEIWKPIAGYEGYYEVSNLGNVRSVNRIIISSNGNSFNYKSKLLKSAKNRDGYLQVALSKNSITNTYFVHRLIAIAFISNLENKPTVNHIDGNKLNNNVLNLEWNTISEQSIHAINKKLKIMPNVWKGKFGSKHGASKKVIKLSIDNVQLKTYNSIIEAANDNKIKYPSRISNVCKGNRETAGGFKWKYNTCNE